MDSIPATRSEIKALEEKLDNLTEAFHEFCKDIARNYYTKEEVDKRVVNVPKLTTEVEVMKQAMASISQLDADQLAEKIAKKINGNNNVMELLKQYGGIILLLGYIIARLVGAQVPPL